MRNEVLIPSVPVDTDRIGMREAVGGLAFVFALLFFVFALRPFLIIICSPDSLLNNPP